MLDGNAEDVGNDSLQDYGIPDGAILEGFVHNHPKFNSDGAVHTEYTLVDNFDLLAMVHADGYHQPAHNITADLTTQRTYIVHDNVIDEYDYATHNNINYPTDKIYVYPDAVKDSTAIIAG